jgi:hypothetical protein
MGNAQSTSQKIEQIIENYAETNSISTAKSSCSQEITVDARGATIRNCTEGIQVDQSCTAMSDIKIDSVLSALQSAELDAQAKQAVEGLALSMQISVTDHGMRSKILNKLVSNCRSNADNVMASKNHYDLRDTTIDCSKYPGGKVIHATQYGDAESTCVVRQIVDSQQQSSGSVKVEQDNKGFQLPDFGAGLIGFLAMAFVLPMILPMISQMKGNKRNNKSVKE